MAIFGWLVLFFVFVGEVLGIAALADWGAHQGGFWIAVLCAGVGFAIWFLFASPGARLGDRFIRPLVKVVLIAIAATALWASGHECLSLWFLGYSAVFLALSQLPAIRVIND